MNYLCDILSAIVLVAVAVIEARASKDRKNLQAERERTEKRAARRAEENRLSIQMQEATLRLTTIMAKKLANKETNGDVDEALTAAKNAAGAYETFLDKIAAEQIAKV